MIQIGTPLTLEGQSFEKRGASAKYRTKVIDINNEAIYIDYPVDTETNKTAFIPLNTEFEAKYLGKDNVVYAFKTTLLQRMKLTVPALELTRPTFETVTKIQRRQYFRVDTAIDITIQKKMYPTELFNSITLNLSGGGVAILKKDIIMDEGETIILHFALPFSSGDITHVQAEAKVVRISYHNRIDFVSMSFTKISDKDRQVIMHYCFEKQREARRKELS